MNSPSPKDRLQFYYEEHANQARQHENQRERMTSIILVMTGALLAILSLKGFADQTQYIFIATALLGLYGWIFSKKHYERNRYHIYIMREIRREMAYVDGQLIHRSLPDDLHENEKDAGEVPGLRRTLSQIKDEGVLNHYIEQTVDEAKIRELIRKCPEGERPGKGDVELARRSANWIARTSLHGLWEGLHIIIFAGSLIIFFVTVLG